MRSSTRIALRRLPRNMRHRTCPPRRSLVASDARRRGQVSRASHTEILTPPLAARRVQHSRLAPRRPEQTPAPHAVGTVASAQTAALARPDQEGLAYLSLLPHPTRSRRHRRSLLAHAFQHHSCHGRCTLTSSQDLSRLNRLGTKATVGVVSIYRLLESLRTRPSEC